MLSILADRSSRDCDGTARRDFLSIGALGMGGFGLPQLLAQRAHAAESGLPVKDTSVVWLWLGGGPTHIETFDPKMSAPAEFRSITGEVATVLPGVSLGGHFPKMARIADKLAIVRSFAHRNSGHAGGTHWVMTGYDNRQADNGAKPIRPALGAITAKVRGTNHPQSGVPTYVRMNGIGADGPAFLGTACGPFDPQGQARKNMKLETKLERLSDRRALLEGLDRFQRDADASGLMNGLDEFEAQAFNMILGDATRAFDISKEPKGIATKYGKGLGEQMLVARRLCEAGCGFVTINFGGWDMHGQLANAMKSRGPQVDHAVATFVEDIAERGLSEKILLVITGEFGRTPRVNRTAGRDHWAPLSTLALAGGGLKMGQVVGESSAKAEVPKTAPIGPQDLMATVFQVLGLDRKLQFTNFSGRPTYLIEDGTPIRDLV
ncbi:MAG: DUF1501 domain-containing protein [Planctomycetes bacterium]|nr:DUF1501 domain-containing protein [Planctomycetota bacterium]